MKKFEVPEIEVAVMDVTDVITTSFIPPEQGENQTPYG